LLPRDCERDATRIPQLTPELHSAMLGFLAMTPSTLWLVNQEDMTKVPYQQNLPGTTEQYPNWSRKMRWSLEDLRELAEARDCSALVRHWADLSGRSRK
jgi:4-alpha-glucanotransferase